MTDILELAKRVEALDGPDRKLDLDIWWQCKANRGSAKQPMPEDYRQSNLRMNDAPRYTASLDAAMTLVPVGCSWMLSVGGAAIAQVTDCTGDACTAPPDYEGRARTPALALVAAALRAKEATNEQ